MHGHGVVSHDVGTQVVVVDLDGYVLTHQGILAGFNEEIAFGVLDGGAFPGQGREVFFQLGPQFRIWLLGAQTQRKSAKERC